MEQMQIVKTVPIRPQNKVGLHILLSELMFLNIIIIITQPHKKKNKKKIN